MQQSERADVAKQLDLSGIWRFQLDPDDVGVKEGWWQRALPDTISLPGSLQAQGYGNDVTLDTPWVGLVREPEWYKDPRYAPYQPEAGLRFPFWLQPEKHYVGPAWYQRQVTVPEEWAGRRIKLVLERVHWESRVWVDDAEIGSADSLATAHQYDLTPHLSPGEHTITIRVDNRMVVDVGENAHSVSDHTQTNWNGIIGTLALQAFDPVWIADIQIFPDVAQRSARVVIQLANETGEAVEGELHLAARSYNTPSSHTPAPKRVPFTLDGNRAEYEVVYELGPDAQLWDEFHPALYRLTVTVAAQARAAASQAPHDAQVLQASQALQASQTPQLRGLRTPHDALAGQEPQASRAPQDPQDPQEPQEPQEPHAPHVPHALQAGQDPRASHAPHHPHQPHQPQAPSSPQFTDTREVTFGLREFTTQGTQFVINGRKTFLRGTLECAIFPLTGYPATDVASWRRIMKVIKAHGLNHIRFHSWCPPEAAFVAADEEGVYFQVECGLWATFGKENGVEEWLERETERIVRAFGNHPSFVMLAHGNEPHGDHVGFLKNWVNKWQAKDRRRLYTSGAGWPVIPESDYHSMYEPRIQRWGEELKSRINAQPPATTADYSAWVEKYDAPIVSHEIGQWCAYPNFAEIEKYTGFLKAKNFELFRESLAAHHMGDQANDFLMASGKLQTICYKEDIESALRTPGFGGFQLLDLHDFPGQGTALVGVVDAFWEPKGYVTAGEFRRFCNSTVLLARLERRIFTQSQPFFAALEIAHFGLAPLEDAIVMWRLLDDRGKGVRMGKLGPIDIPIGNGIRLGDVRFDWAGLPTARRYRLEVYLEGHDIANDWDVWLFPDHLPTEAPAGVSVVQSLDETTLARLAAGEKVLLLVDPAKVKTRSQIGFSPVFWNTAWTENQAPHTLGILCDPDHPAFRHFPTDFHTNWQWWELLHNAAAMELEALPPQLRPIVQPIDTWFRNLRLGLLFEARVAGGKLMVCSMDLGTDLDQRPVARQMRYSLLRYMASDEFSPTVTVDPATLQTLWE